MFLQTEALNVKTEPLNLHPKALFIDYSGIFQFFLLIQRNFTLFKIKYILTQSLKSHRFYLENYVPDLPSTHSG